MTMLEFNTSHHASFMLAPEADRPAHLQTLPAHTLGGLEQLLAPRAMNLACPFNNHDLTNFWSTK